MGSVQAVWNAGRKRTPNVWGENVKPPPGDKDGEKAREHFHYLLLDSQKKDRETMMKAGLASTAIKRKCAVNDTDDDKSGPLRPNNTPSEAIRVLLIDPDKPMDLV